MTEILSKEQYEKMKEDANEVIKILCGIYESGQDLPPGEDRMMIAEAFSTVIRSLPRELLFAVVTNLIGERLSLIETVNVLSDPHIVADLEEAERDISSGNLIPAGELREVLEACHGTPKPSTEPTSAASSASAAGSGAASGA